MDTDIGVYTSCRYAVAYEIQVLMFSVVDMLSCEIYTVIQNSVCRNVLKVIWMPPVHPQGREGISIPDMLTQNMVYDDMMRGEHFSCNESYLIRSKSAFRQTWNHGPSHTHLTTFMACAGRTHSVEWGIHIYDSHMMKVREHDQWLNAVATTTHTATTTTNMWVRLVIALRL